ncbi:MAG: phosphatidate cytidylyltransferase [Lachnospiraceae bacterium]|nr:phosphatidate cytidylyltransferase [Lachnospiraceae bacterium]
MFWKRFISGAVILVLTLGFGIIGGPFLATGLGVLSCIAYIEYTKVTKVREEGHRMNGIEIIGLITIILYYFMLLIFELVSHIFPESVVDWLFTSVGFFTNYTIILLLILLLGVVSTLCVYIFCYPKFDNKQVAGGIFGLIYTSFMMSFIYYTRELENGVFLIWLIFITSWVSDTGAYFVGSAIGKHKMTPNLSPKKSWEGAIGGILIAGCAAALYGLFYAKHFSLRLYAIPIFGLIGCLGAFLAMCGDLVASAFKRNNNVKDYSNLIPGHGGVLDRFDSVLFTAPLVYFLIVLFMSYLFK